MNRLRRYGMFPEPISAMKSNQELFDFIDELIQFLNSASEIESARKLNSAMNISSSPTEIFFCLRNELRNILKLNIALVDERRQRAIEAVEDLNLALSQ